MKLISILFISMIFSSDLLVCDFNTIKDVQKWYQTNDDVMGGISNSKMFLNAEKHGVFTGNVSTANNGGFAMTRLPVDLTLNDQHKKIVLRVQGDGKQYQFRLKASNRQRYWYVCNFQTSNKMQNIEIPLLDFYPSFRGYRIDRSNFSSNKIQEIGILIGNKRNENFKLIIDNITIK